MSRLNEQIRGMTADLPASYWYLWIGTVINRLGGFVVPFLSLYLTSARGISIGQAGLMVSLLGLGSFASQLTGGELADRLGRRPVMLISLLGGPVVTVILGLVHTLPVIAICTMLLGFFMDLYRPAVSAAVSDLVPSHARTRAFGYLYWAINLGAAVAPILAGFLAHLDYFLLFAGDAITTLLCGLLILWRVPESQPSEAVQAARLPLSSRMRQVGREPILLVFAVLTLLTGLIYMQGIVTLPLDMRLHGLDASAYGLAISANGILIVFTTIQLSKIVGRWPRFGAMAAALLFLGIGFGLTAFADSLLTFVISVMVWTVGEIIGSAVAPTIIADLAPVELRGLYQGIYGSAWGLSFFIGPALGSLVFERASPEGLWLGCAILGGAIAITYLALSASAHRRLAQTGSAES